MSREIYERGGWTDGRLGMAYGLVRGNSDNTSKQIAYGELEDRGIIRRRF